MQSPQLPLVFLARLLSRPGMLLPVMALVWLCAALSGCASHGPAVPQPFPRPGAHDNPASPTDAETGTVAEGGTAPLPGGVAGAGAVAPSLVAQGVVSMALHLVGTPYRNGGAGPDGFDCSGFVQYVFGQQGVSVPRTVDELARSGARVDELQPGDLVFFHTSGRGPTHVGIAIDGGRFVHAPSSRGEVRVEPITRPYWAERFVQARRVVVAAAP